MEFQYEENRVFLEDQNGKLIAEITFPVYAENVVDIDHTFVDPCLRGQGVADRLVRAAIERIEKNDRKAVASCSYAARWFEAHPEACGILHER